MTCSDVSVSGRALSSTCGSHDVPNCSQRSAYDSGNAVPIAKAAAVEFADFPSRDKMCARHLDCFGRVAHPQGENDANLIIDLRDGGRVQRGGV
jgi:hypothetical protein